MKQKITIKNLNVLCDGTMGWKKEDIEARFHGSRQELVDTLNQCDELELELFFTGFFCDNPIVALAADGDCDIQCFAPKEKVQIFIKRGYILCYFTNNEPGFVVKPCWFENKHQEEKI